MSSARGPKRAWTAQRTTEAVAMLHDIRRRVLAVSMHAPIGSLEYEALIVVMTVTAQSLKIFGYDVMSAPARSVIEAMQARAPESSEDI
ncbi:hypothetical protein V5F77_02300 [Xanthobacter sp. DSM 24535]|uniref:hypothetical protein n=1 Tax=Roseixanthobacter psychrophilus TaxID=3119917 RepID=UPI0037293F4A